MTEDHSETSSQLEGATKATSMSDDGNSTTIAPTDGSFAPPPSAPTSVIIRMVKPSALIDRLENVTLRSTPPESEMGHPDVPTLTLTAPDSKNVKSDGKSDGYKEGVPEFYPWDHEAEEDVAKGLARLGQLAYDEHLREPSKSVQQYYSARLAKLIKAGTVEFDLDCMNRGGGGGQDTGGAEQSRAPL